MSLITLITDWHNDDYYVGALKGMLYGKCPDLRIIDITHKIDSFKFTQAAFVIRNIYKIYPQGTVHLIGINSESSPEKPPLCVKVFGQYFIGGADNLFGMMFEETPEMVIHLQENDFMHNSTFPELTMYGQAAAFIVNGGDPKELGNNVTNSFRFTPLMPVFDEFSMTGIIIYIDSYKNVITNIDKNLFELIRKNRKFVITIKSANYQIHTISQHYNEVGRGEIVAVFNSIGFLELAIRESSLATLLDVQLSSQVHIRFL